MLIASLSLANRFLQLVVASICLIALAWFIIPSSFDVTRFRPEPVAEKTPLPPKLHHPIDELVRRADEELNGLIDKQTQTLQEAAQAYRDRRGRQPPPGFDRWHAFAQNRSAVMVEDFFDRIYHDLNPFWAVPAQQIREQANGFFYRISIRNGNATQRFDGERPWMHLWRDMLLPIANQLPDMDLPINVMDESRIVVPWEEINDYMSVEKTSRRVVPASKLKTEFSGLKDLDRHPPEAFEPDFANIGPYWPLAVVGCHPDTPARSMYIETDFSTRPPLPPAFPNGSYQGYVQNWTLATSPCENPTLQGMHGSFIEPVSIATTNKFFPLFGGSKLPMNNEILLPPAMYWTDDPFYSGGDDHGSRWDRKKDMIGWRGSGTGGRNRKENWTRFQRHRFVSMLNTTMLELADSVPGYVPPNFELTAQENYDLAARKPGIGAAAFARWVDTWSDAALTDLICFPDDDHPHCPYTDPYFTLTKFMPMKAQYGYKYLADIDGNSFSGRYRGFLGSTSMPIKATIYKEWHDDRLVPWKHFVPMDNTFVDIYGIMEYFVGNRQQGLGGHDEVARNIALEGKAWAEKVLRHEDMQIYVFRLLLEYGRLCDDDRDVLGWAEPGVS